MIDDAGGRFALNGSGQVITAGDIDYEIYDSHLITVEATNDSGLSTTKTFEILVEDEAGDEPEGIVRFEFGRNLPNVIPEEDIVLTYSLATDINSRNFYSLYQAVVEDAGEEWVGYSWSGDIYSEAGYNANLTTSGYKPAYSDLVSKLGDINSKLTLVDDTVIFKAGQTTQSESLVVKVEGELPEFISLVSPDLLVCDDPGSGGLVPSSFFHQFGTELSYLFYDDVSVWQATEEQSTSVVQFEFGRNLPNVIPEEDIVLTYSLATDINSRNFYSLYRAVVEDAGEEWVGWSASGDIYSEAGYNANLSTSGYKPAYSDLVSKLGDINSKLTLVDDTVIFKAGQTTESEGLVVKVEGELPEFISLVSPDLLVFDDPGEPDLVPSSFFISLALS